MSVFFIGDIHLGHKNIIKFGQRDFAATVEEHDERMISNWNSVVGKRGLVWALGDVAFTDEALEKLSRLNGRKILIAGNHDRYNAKEYLKYFEDIRAFEKRYDGLIMTHIPVHPREMVYRNWKYNVHGHLHGYDIEDDKYINVNADRPMMRHTPISLDEIRTLIAKRENG